MAFLIAVLFFLQALFSFSQALLLTQCRFKNLTKQERSSQMLNLFLPPNFLEIRTKLQTWLLKLLCQSFQVHLPSPVLFIPSISREF
ncbi:uncharacterized protein DS421_11g335940 [Arachis hypogaea]|nr:uncharacterized protein DS421_11g335940 [Arachis hypogaea]QHO20213.1 uncharacterized protein DS421_11g335940 [Arachis hypogaea]